MTGTAQVLGALLSAAATSGDGSAFSILKYVVGGIGFLIAGPMATQAISEFVIAILKLTNPIYKAFMPRIIGWAIGGIGSWAGLDSATAAASGIYLSELAHIWNQTPWAMDLELKLQALEGKPVVQPPFIDPAAGAAPKLAILLALGACLLAGPLKADMAFWNCGTFGSQVYDRQPDGSWSNAEGGVLMADEFAYGWGHLNADNTFTPYIAIMGGGGPELRKSEIFTDLVLGLGTAIPGTPGIFTAGGAIELGTGRPAGLAVALSVPISTTIWSKK